jgi:hypothetical protein
MNRSTVMLVHKVAIYMKVADGFVSGLKSDVENYVCVISQALQIPSILQPAPAKGWCDYAVLLARTLVLRMIGL